MTKQRLMRKQWFVAKQFLTAALAFSAIHFLQVEALAKPHKPVPVLVSPSAKSAKKTKLTDEEVAKLFEPVIAALHGPEVISHRKLQNAFNELKKAVLPTIDLVDGDAKTKIVLVTSNCLSALDALARISNQQFYDVFLPQTNAFSDEFSSRAYGGKTSNEISHKFEQGTKKGLLAMNLADRMAITSFVLSMKTFEDLRESAAQIPEGKAVVVAVSINHTPYRDLIMSFFEMLQEISTLALRSQGI